jgi:hypothetical protein
MSDEDLRLVYPNWLLHLLCKLLQNISIFAHVLLKRLKLLGKNGVVGGELNSLRGVSDIKRVALFDVKAVKHFPGQDDADRVANELHDNGGHKTSFRFYYA